MRSIRRHLRQSHHPLMLAAAPRGLARRLRLARSLAALVGVALIASGCTTTRSHVSTQYYEVSGSTPRALDRELRRKGPDGGRAVAMAGISIKSVDLDPSVSDGLCRFRRAKFRVDAALTLPRWREAASSRDAALRERWSGFAAYARAHEETHVRIAEAFARAIEQSFLAIPPQPSCDRLAAIGLERLRRAQTLHRQAQLAFDAAEQRRFAELAARAERRNR